MLEELIKEYEAHRKVPETKQKENAVASPIVQWVGGKRQLIAEYESYLPDDFDTYYEPFAGGAALLFHFWSKFGKNKNYYISDMNKELITTYNEVARDYTEVNRLVNLMHERHTKEFYYAIRNIDRKEIGSKRYKKEFDIFDKLTDAEVAARFLYLNRTCFNALYRVNGDNLFNVPVGKSLKKSLAMESALSLAQPVFKATTIKYGCYSNVESLATSKDFVFFDPPYAPLTATSSFTSYTKDGFDTKDQIALRDLCNRLDKKGVRFALSNSNCELMRELYKDFDIKIFDVNRNLNSDKTKRKKSAQEIFVTNFT